MRVNFKLRIKGHPATDDLIASQVRGFKPGHCPEALLMTAEQQEELRQSRAAIACGCDPKVMPFCAEGIPIEVKLNHEKENQEIESVGEGSGHQSDIPN